MPGTLAIRNMSLVTITPRDYPDPESLRLRIEEAVRGSLPTALSEGIGDWPGEGVLRIRRVEIDLAVEAALPPERIASRLARAIADALFTAQKDGERVLSYPDRAHFLAAFLQELAQGRAWQRWWFRSFDGLKPLSCSAAIRTAVLADPGGGLEALLTMSSSDAAAVLAALTAGDAATVLDGLAGLGPANIPIEAAIAIVADTDVSVIPFFPIAAPAAQALAIFLEAARRHRDHVGPLLAQIALAIVALDHVLATQRTKAVREILPSLKGEAPTPQLSMLDARLVARVAPLLTLPAAARRAVLDGAAVRRGITTKPVARTSRRYTPFGGLFLLLPSLPSEKIAAAIAGASSAEDVPLDRVIGALVIAACAGRERVLHVLADPVWRDLFALPNRVGVADLADRLTGLAASVWPLLNALGEALETRQDARFLLPPRLVVGSSGGVRVIAGLARGVLSHFARRLPGGFARSSAVFLWRNLLSVSAAVDETPHGLSVVLNRPPLDVLLALSGVADADIWGPQGVRLCLRRERI
jgi:hypothetical protein